MPTKYVMSTIAFLALATLIAGCGSNTWTTGENTSSNTYISDASRVTISPTVSPTNLSYTGGTVTITANVTTEVVMQTVWTEITKSDSTKDIITMQQQDDNSYQGTYTAPPNCTAAAKTYIVHICAMDCSNPPVKFGPVPSNDSLTFTVGIADTPPPLPNW